MTTLPRLSDIEADMLASCIDALGDAIAYKVSGGAWTSLRAYVDLGEDMRDIGAGQVIEQAYTVEVMKTGAAKAKPGPATRVRISKVADTTFRPVNVRSSSDGLHWIFELEKVNA